MDSKSDICDIMCNDLYCPGQSHCRRHAPEKVLMHCADKLSDDELHQAAVNAPEYALTYAWRRLDDQDFDYCVKKDPFVALQCAVSRMSEAQRWYAINLQPRAALKYALDILSDEDLHKCAVAAPSTALNYAGNCLSDETFKHLVVQHPWEILRFVYRLVNPRYQLGDPVPMVGPEDDLGRLSRKDFDISVRTETYAASKFAIHYLSEEQLDLCRKNWHASHVLMAWEILTRSEAVHIIL